MAAYSQVVGRAETESGAIYQFTTHRYADGSQRTQMQRLPGRDGNTLHIAEPVTCPIPTNLRVGESLTLSFIDEWGEDRLIRSSRIVRVDSWIVD